MRVWLAILAALLLSAAVALFVTHITIKKQVTVQGMQQEQIPHFMAQKALVLLRLKLSSYLMGAGGFICVFFLFWPVMETQTRMRGSGQGAQTTTAHPEAGIQRPYNPLLVLTLGVFGLLIVAPLAMIVWPLSIGICTPLGVAAWRLGNFNRHQLQEGLARSRGARMTRVGMVAGVMNLVSGLMQAVFALGIIAFSHAV